MDEQESRITDAADRPQRVSVHLGAVYTFCAECGVNVKIDEDGCCASCGADAMPADEMLKQYLGDDMPQTPKAIYEHGIRLWASEKATLEAQIAELQDIAARAQQQLLSILVMDLGYDHRPLHGHQPIRHQMGWSYAIEGRTEQDVAEQVRRCKETVVRDADYTAVQLKDAAAQLNWLSGAYNKLAAENEKLTAENTALHQQVETALGAALARAHKAEKALAHLQHRSGR